MLSSEMRNLILSQLQSGKKFTQVVRDFRSVCSESTVTRILRESNARNVIRKRRGPPRKIDRNMEKRVVRSLTIGKRVTTIRGAARKENVAVNTVRRMLERKRINTFKKVQRFLITKQNGARRKLCCGRMRRTFRTADLAHMLWVNECYIVVGEYFNHQNESCYEKRFDLIPDFNRCRRVPKSPLRKMVFVAM